MHELSLAQNIIDSIRENVGENRIPLVTKVRMEIGAASGVASDSLSFAFDAIVQGTSLASATMEMELIPFKVHCNECNNDSENDSGYMTCMMCHSLDVTVVSGTEIFLKQIELNDE